MLLKQRKGRARETTDAKFTKLIWGDGEYELDIPLDRSNVATICLDAGYALFKLFLATSKIDLHDEDPVCFKSQDDIVADDNVVEPASNSDDWQLPERPLSVDLNGPQNPDLLQDPQVERHRRVERELLDLHVLANHFPFPRLQAMDKSGQISRRFA